VIHGCPYDGKPQGDIYTVAEVEELEGDESLVVVLADDGVIMSMDRPVKDGVRGMGTARLAPAEPCGLDGRGDDPPLLVPEHAGLPGVGIEAGDRDARPIHSEIPYEGLMRDLDGLPYDPH